jgi:hypothetical protein
MTSRSNNNYRKIRHFGYQTDKPSFASALHYSIVQTPDSEFVYGSNAAVGGGRSSQQSRTVLAEFCSLNADNPVCKIAVNDPSPSYYPNMVQRHLQKFSLPPSLNRGSLSKGDVNLSNMAYEKYLVGMGGYNCRTIDEPFDPRNPESPMIRSYRGATCTPVLSVDPSKIDNDSVMNQVLDRPRSAWSVLVNIYFIALKQPSIPNVNIPSLNSLKGTRLYSFFMSKLFQDYIKQFK